MRIGFDVTPLVSRGSGVARYTIELLRALRDSSTDVELTLLSNKPVADPETSAELRGLTRIDAPDFPSRQVWMQAVLPRAMTHDHLDLGHFTNFDAPLLRSVPAVVTLHDMSLLIAPHLHPARRVLMLTPLMRLAAGRAEAVVCPTHSARRDAIRHLHLDPQRVHVLSGSAAPTFRVLDDAAATDAVCERYGLEPGFVLFVGTIEPRKNLVRLARAYSRLRRSGFVGQLVICGGWGWKSADLRPRIERMGISDSVVFTDYVPDDDIVALLNAAGAFVYPSLYEGFGLPVVEAFACGVPVVTSNRGAMAEVAGDAALLVEPTSTEELTDALRRALTDSVERARLRTAGLARAAQFNRTRTAREAIATYRAVLAR